MAQDYDDDIIELTAVVTEESAQEDQEIIFTSYENYFLNLLQIFYIK